VTAAINEWLKNVPPQTAAFYGSLLAFSASLLVAFIGFGSVLFQNWKENRRVGLRLKHEADLKRVEREMDLKRDAFLIACEGMAAASEYLARFADLSLSREKHQEIVKQVATKVHRVHLIANKETLGCLVEFYETYIEYLIELEALRLPVIAKNDAVLRNDAYTAQVKETFRVLNDKLIDLRITRNDPQVLAAAVEQVRMVMKEMEDASEQQVQLRLSLLPIHRAFASTAMQRSLDLGSWTAKAVAAMRDELGFPLDAKEYESALAQSRQRVREKFTQFFEQAERLANTVKSP
jgi:hypothetical protein